MSAGLWYHLYGLRFGSSDDRAQGALLKYCFDNDLVGFASLSAWPRAGDRTLDEKLKDLRNNPSMEPQWSWASLDAQWRAEKRPALPIESHFPQSHWHMRGADLRNPERWAELVAGGYYYWKVKVAPSSFEAIPIAKIAKFAHANSVKLRLDGNGAFGSIAELESFVSPLAEMRAIDFFEDPSQDSNLWAEIKRRWGIRLAADWLCSRDYPCDLVIHKPSRDASVPDERDFVITTSFDHPLGLNYTAYRSLQLKDHPHLRMPLGINHPDLYTCDGVASEITLGAIGFGWPDLLNNVTWRRL